MGALKSTATYNYTAIRCHSDLAHSTLAVDGWAVTFGTVSSIDFNAARSSVTFGCLNVRSVLSKFDDIVELCRDHLVDLLCLTETWHDTDSVVLGRLRSA